MCRQSYWRQPIIFYKASERESTAATSPKHHRHQNIKAKQIQLMLQSNYFPQQHHRDQNKVKNIELVQPGAFDFFAKLFNICDFRDLKNRCINSPTWLGAFFEFNSICVYVTNWQNCSLWEQPVDILIKQLMKISTIYINIQCRSNY